MTNYYIIDQIKNGDCFGGKEPLTNRDGTPVTEEQAIAKANAAWNHLTEYEKSKRLEFFLVEAPADEDGCCDLDRSMVITEYAI